MILFYLHYRLTVPVYGRGNEIVSHSSRCSKRLVKDVDYGQATSQLQRICARRWGWCSVTILKAWQRADNDSPWQSLDLPAKEQEK